MIDDVINLIRRAGDDSIKLGFLLCVPPLVKAVDRWDRVLERNHIALAAATPKGATLLTTERWPTAGENNFYEAQLEPNSGGVLGVLISAIESKASDLVVGGVVMLGKKPVLETHARNVRRIIKAGKVPLLIALTSSTEKMFLMLCSTIALPRRHAIH